MITADLGGKVALVTGGASGIGLATVELLAANGCAVAINDLARNPRLEAEVARLSASGHRVAAAPGDVGNMDEVEAMVAAVIARFGRLDYLVNNAATPGTSKPIPVDDFATMDEAFWAKLVNVNQIGPYRCVKAAAAHLKAAKGAIVNVASTAGLAYGASSSVYASTKAAIILLTKEWAYALGPEVRVNAIAPNVVDGSGWDCRFDPQAMAATIARMPLKRAGKPADYAETIFYLLAGAPYVTGQTIVMDGGGVR
ncbi:3-oxoacyl-[acyl-carrier protein] reductase [Dongia mobilis]|uniref:3-oxoacyl-[acyl-carrier protein] reductase n=1 Tax=Dongia mobilis TaxID=578943 RepID=A0A4R6WTW2_9PROT|nr:SDR family oxidoreductase [Dongia mobilis]TDQ83113.1 3-oxoacyl-[acyl-carrier protein] reductase [Dongia mobilis]